MQGSRQGAPAARILTLAIWLSLAACARSDPVPTVASGPLPSASARPMTADRLANDAVDRDELLSLLDDAGFEGATELVGADRAAGIHQASVRAVAFADGDGADRYLGWLSEHADEVIGVASPVGDVGPPDADATIEVFRHEPGDCCPKATVSYLTAWREDEVVVVLQLAGPSVEASDVSAAAERVELGP